MSGISLFHSQISHRSFEQEALAETEPGRLDRLIDGHIHGDLHNGPDLVFFEPASDSVLWDPRASKQQITLATRQLVRELESIPLRDRDFRLIGPIHGDHTFGAYRAMDVDALDEIDLYDFESSLRLDWSIMQSAGFDTVGEYRSSISRLPTSTRAGQAAHPNDLPDDCAIVSARIADMSSQDLLKTIYDISNESFKNNLFYKDIGFAAFKDLYARASVQANDTYVYFAKVGEIYAGFVYAFIDRSKNALIAKTIAVLPQYRRCHLARAMMSVLANDASRALNLDLDLNFADPHASPALVHAYFHQDNVSRHLAQAPDTDLADLRILRSYRLFAHDHRQRKTR